MNNKGDKRPLKVNEVNEGIRYERQKGNEWRKE